MHVKVSFRFARCSGIGLTRLRVQELCAEPAFSSFFPARQEPMSLEFVSKLGRGKVKASPMESLIHLPQALQRPQRLLTTEGFRGID